jgi:hypothetical protein
MYAAVATLKLAAQKLQLSGELDPSKYARMMSQLRGVTDELTAFERRARTQKKANPVNFAELLSEVMATASPTNAASGNGMAAQLPDPVLVEGPVEDLRDLLSCLIEYALSVDQGPIKFGAEIRRDGDEVSDKCAAELVIRSPDVPDFLRRKLWDAVRVRRGEVSLISEPDCCRIGFTLPIERRHSAWS